MSTAPAAHGSEARRGKHEGVLEWLRNVWKGRTRRPPAPPPPPTRPRASRAAPPPPPQPAEEPEPPEADPFAPYRRALCVEIPPEAPIDEATEAGDRELAERILAHFRANKPPPASFPALAMQILNLIARPDAEVAELARLIGRDPALSASILSVANSAYYRAAMEIETVRDAITRLGLNEVGRVAGAVSARTLFNPRMRAEQAVFGPRWSGLFHRAITVASGAAWLSLRNRRVRSDRAYLGGLLHDVGTSVALRSLAALVLDGKVKPAPDDARIARVLERVHTEVGGEAHQTWNLPHYLTVLAVRHHDAEIPDGEEFIDLHAVRLAAAVEDLRGPFAARAAGELVQSAGALRLDPFAVRALAAELRAAEARTAALFGISP
jgi:HD-like signal output (HDOD) protein